MRELYRDQSLSLPKYRTRTMDDIFREMHLHKNHGTNLIYLADDFFIRPAQEMRTFFARYKEEIDLPFFGNFHPSQLYSNPDIFALLVQSGLISCTLPIQSGSEYFSQKFFGRKNNNKEVLSLLHRAYDAFLSTHTDFIEGFVPPEMDPFEDNLNFVKGLPPFSSAFPMRMAFNVNMLRVRHNSPLEKTYPNLSSYILSEKDFFYRAMLLNFRHILSDEAFAALRSDHRHRETPEPLLGMLHDLVAAKHNAYVLQQAERLAGKELYFWGCGEIYQANKHLFLGARPQGILLTPWAIKKGMRRVGGLPILDGHQALQDGIDTPIVIFSSQALDIARKIRLLRPDYCENNIIACQALGKRYGV